MLIPAIHISTLESMINKDSSSKIDSIAKPLQLYVHVPFCEKKCHYCDFASWELPAIRQRQWTEVLLREIDHKAYSSRPISTLFFGGGTPSLLASEFMERIVQRLTERFDFSQITERSIECNPSSLTKEKLDLFHHLGFNRLSLGVQSFHAHELKTLGRVHTPESAQEALRQVSSDGRFQFSGDLIFGLAGQTVSGFLKNLEILLGYYPDHVSFYGLTIEGGTEFDKQTQAGLKLTSEDEIYNEMYSLGVKYLEDRGYHRYEVSNFCRENRVSKHNCGYWNGAEYIAFGPGAHGLFKGERIISPRSFEGYLAWGDDNFNAATCESEILTQDNCLSEFVSLSLRQASGLDLMKLESNFGKQIPANILHKWNSVGLLHTEDHAVNLQGEGWLYLDEIAADFLARLTSVKALHK